MREVIIPFAVGLTLFIFGMQVMRIGLSNFAGNQLQDILYRFTQTPYHAFLTGLITTMFMQSSSAVTVITIGLTNARVIKFPQTIGIILGANIGTCFTTELIVLDVGLLAMPMVGIGAILWLTNIHLLRCIGLTFAGFGCIFLGMEAMSMIKYAVENSDFVHNLFIMASEKLWIGIVVGTVLTAVIQSSSATTAMAMSFMSDQYFTLPIAIAIVLGANIGTCFTAIIAAIGGIRASKQVACAHILVNILGVIVFYPLIHWLASIVTALTDVPQAQIAHAQTIFNIICSVALLPFCKPFAKLVQLIVPDEALKY